MMAEAHECGWCGGTIVVKVCTWCRRSLPISQFSTYEQNGRRVRRSRCRECTAANTRLWRIQNGQPDQLRGYLEAVTPVGGIASKRKTARDIEREHGAA